MEEVYMLLHSRDIKDEEEVSETKIIGFYSSRKKAKETIEKYKKIEGFKDYPKDFVIEKYVVDFDNFDFE